MAAALLYRPDLERAALERDYAASPSVFLDVAGLRLHVRDTGPRDAPALLLLHGFGASLHGWDDWVPLLEPHFRVIRLDLPGFGLTGPDPTGDYSDERAIAVLLALLDRLGLDRVIVVGHSMGGRIAWRFAVAHPERVSRLALVAPDGFASPGLEYGRAPRVPPMLRVLPYVLPMPLLRATLAPAYGDPRNMTPARVALYRAMLLAPGVRRAILDRTAQTVLVDPRPLLRTLTVPVLLLWGARDAMIPPANAQDYLRALPHARLVAFPAAGHLLMEEAPAESAAALQRFLAE